MHRLNISIPDSLWRALDEFRKQLNLSQICTLALEAQLKQLKQERRMERIADQISDMNTLIARLKEEKSALLRQSFEDGVKDAEKWIVTATYQDIAVWVRIGEEREHDVYTPPLPVEILQYWEEKRRDPMEAYSVPNTTEEEIEFAEGFYTTLLSKWNIIDHELFGAT